MRRGSLPRWHVVVAAVCLSLAFRTVGGVSLARVGASFDEWIPPVGGAVLRPFVAPVAVYAAGHRGVDFSAAPGAPVRAANDGTVSFAGEVAGSLHVVVAHAAGIRTSYSFLASADVRTGDHVRRGQAIGRAGGSGEGHGAGVLHFGVRIGDRYVDPMLLFRPRDLTQIVRLVPAGELAAVEHADPQDERRELALTVAQPPDDDSCAGALGDIASFVGLGGGAEAACDALESAIDAGLQVLSSLDAGIAELVDQVEPFIAAVVDRMRRLGEELTEAAAAVAGAAAGAVTEVVDHAIEAARQLYVELTSCPQPEPELHPKGSGNLVMAVGGLDSSREQAPDGSLSASFHLEASVLGYRRGEVSYFSYRAGSLTYTARDTTGDVDEKARLLGRQLQELGAQHPGRRIDLVAHSQGGVVVDLFLTDVYRGHEDEFPVIVNVVTFSSPHEGTPFANLQHAVSERPFLTGIARRFSSAPLGARALDDLQEGAPTIRRVEDAAYPRVRFLSIVGSEDLGVPSSSADPPIGQKTVVSVGGGDHAGILHDSDALSAAQAHLSGGHPADTCGPLVDVQGHLASSFARAATAAVETVGT